MKNLKYMLVATAIFVGCTDNHEQLILDNGKQTSFTEITATFSEGADTRMGLSNDNHLYWSQSDVIGVYSDQQGIEKYANPSIGQEGAVFRGEKVEGNRFFAFYPYSDNVVIDTKDRNILHLSLESSSANLQTNYGIGYNGSSGFVAPVIARSSGNDFQFKHICGYLCLEVSRANEVVRDENGNAISGYTYRSLTLTGNNGEKLAGAGTVDMSADTPLFVVDPVASETSITTTEFTYGFWGNGIKLYIPLPVMTFEKGITARIELNDMSSSYNYNTGGYDKHVIEVSTDKPVVIERGKVKSMTSLDGKELFENSVSEREQLDIKQRKILKEFYDALDGDNWTNNTNWNSDKPLSEWYGLRVDGNGILTGIVMWYNNLKGDVPEEIGELSTLTYLEMGDYEITSLPETIGNLKSLTYLYLAGIPLESFPEWIFKLKNLRTLALYNTQIYGKLPEKLAETNTALTYLNLSTNYFEGEIPSAYFNNLTKLYYFTVSNNNLVGTITKEQQQSPMWQNLTYRYINPQRDGKLIDIVGAVKEIYVNSTDVTLQVGEEFQLQVTGVYPTDADDTSTYWEISNNNQQYVSFDSATGKVKALQEGTVWIYARASDKNGANTGCRVRVVSSIDQANTENYTVVDGEWDK